jgi:hypothetical protein
MQSVSMDESAVKDWHSPATPPPLPPHTAYLPRTLDDCFMESRIDLVEVRVTLLEVIVPAVMNPQTRVDSL